MKISVDIDISPKEARELMGWPDVTELHKAMVSSLHEQVKSGNQDLMMAALKPYLDGSTNAFTLYQKLMEGLMTSSQDKEK